MNRWRKNRRRKETSEQPHASEPEAPETRRPGLGILLRPFGHFAAALRFLTVVPLPGSIGSSEDELVHAVPFFPLVGLVLGCLAAPVAQGLFLLLPPLSAAVLTTLLLLAFSGGLHLDGLADTADGFFSSRTKERMLEIMRDSAVGPMGAAALTLLLLFKAACLASLSDKELLPAVFLTPVAGRSSILLLMAMLPYARDNGLGCLFAPYFASCPARMAALAGLLLFVGTAHAAAGLQGIAAVFVVLLLAAAFAGLCCRKIGGVTGDALGAVCELAEAAVVLVFAVRI